MFSGGILEWNKVIRVENQMGACPFGMGGAAKSNCPRRANGR